MKKVLPILFGSLLISNLVLGQNFWSKVTNESLPQLLERRIIPEQYKTFVLDLNALKTHLNNAPLEFSSQHIELVLPLPNGKFESFEVQESPIMEKPLSDKYANIKTFVVHGINDRSAWGRVDFTLHGFHAVIRSAEGTIYIDPYAYGDTKDYIVYNKSDFSKAFNDPCQVDEVLLGENFNEVEAIMPASGPILYRYNTCITATGEYSNFHGGTKPLVLSAIVTSLNRLNSVFEVDFAIRLFLNAREDTLIFLNAATDPFPAPSQGVSALLSLNQSTIDSYIGSGNYDFGHIYSMHDDGGIASLGSVCRNSRKAQGATGSNSPVGDPYDIDYVAHEMGHQFGCNHTQNNTCNRASTAAYEPGSASTIMGYAGICPPNLQNNSDPYFHAISLQEGTIYLHTGQGRNCADTVHTGNSTPTVNPGPSYTIPINTPFRLTASSTDADGDTVYYCWEQWDLGTSSRPPNSPSGNSPIFRSFNPTTNPTRVFPRMSDLLKNTLVVGEFLPSYTRTMNFKCTVRDYRMGGGGVNNANTTVTANSNSGPFQVTSINTTGVKVNGGSNDIITWAVANTSALPVNCQFVNILLSVDGGITFTDTILKNTPNDGSEAIVWPNIATTKARIIVEASGNIFFDVNNNDFEIIASGFAFMATNKTLQICAGSSGSETIIVNNLGLFSDSVVVTALNLPAGLSYQLSTIKAIPPFNSMLTVTAASNLPDTSFTFNLQVADLMANFTSTIDITVVVNAGTPGQIQLLSPSQSAIDIPIYSLLQWDSLVYTGSKKYQLQVSTNAQFTNIIEDTILIDTERYLSQSVVLPSNQYYWRIRGISPCDTGAFSTIYNFTTSKITCRTYNATTFLPLPISGFGIVSYNLPLEIPVHTQPIINIDVVNLKGTHSNVTDLNIAITSPSGVSVSMIDNICNGEDDFDLALDDQAPNTVFDCPPTLGKSYVPAEPLSVFNGTNGSGKWLLIVKDEVLGSGGALDSWGLNYCTACITDLSITGLVSNQVCEGDTLKIGVSFTATSVMEYTWKFNGSIIPGAIDKDLVIASISAANSGTYTCVVYNGCNADSMDVTVNLLSSPSMPTISATTTELIASATGAAYYQWFLNGIAIPGATSATLTPAASGIYTVEANSGACSVTSAEYSFFMVAVQDLENNNTLIVYPNPSNKGIFNVDLENNEIEPVILEVFDALGQKVFNNKMHTNHFVLDLSQLNAGIYLLTAKGKHNIYHKALIIE